MALIKRAWQGAMLKGAGGNTNNHICNYVYVRVSYVMGKVLGRAILYMDRPCFHF